MQRGRQKIKPRFFPTGTGTGKASSASGLKNDGRKLPQSAGVAGMSARSTVIVKMKINGK
jgi:hypothetical protein